MTVRVLFYLPFGSDFLDWGMGVLFWILSLILIGGCLWILVFLVDSSFLPIKEKDGIVTNKYIVPAHTTTTYIQVGKVMVPQTHYHETTYNLEITIDGISDDISLYEKDYEGAKVGLICHCKYTSGRILNTIYIKETNW